MKSLIQLFLSILLLNSFIFSQENQSSGNPFPIFTPYVTEQSSADDNQNSIDIKDFGKEQPAMWMSVDPMADKYPGWGPYNYCVNNPLIIIDPNGMWIAEYDKNNNIVSARYEKGDTYEGLYKQLGMTAKDFASKYGVDLSKDISADVSFDITNNVLSNTNFDGNAANGLNCHGFVNFASLNGTNQEQSVSQLNTEGMQTTKDPNTGDIAVFNMQGQYQFKGQESPVEASNIQGHSAVFVLNNQAGEAQYLNRINTGQPVTINTQSQIISFFANPNNAYGGANAYIILPKLNSNPIFYKK